MKTKNHTTIFSTGVHLQSEECIINGKKQWRWVAVGLEDESFLDRKEVNPFEYADKKEKLIEKFKD
ncbi:hypothetical protein KKG29_01805 [Patescibacteria group bacterium]|nr:hypothetical protein [Patescibacteria group bacterium]MBU3999893.1 hypothetical protein [Patescibacteria group bacterium]MBU4056415.1 hypothetical protein [Patescibacteria group bacterium]MBU4368939.1 hypothetical protein [Patescibacteria group bacterium]